MDVQSVPKLASLARMAHKYQFKSTEMWSLGCLSRTFDGLKSIDPEILARVTRVAALCDDPTLLAHLTLLWKRLIGRGEAVALAIVVADELKLRSILGVAYHAMMLKGRAAWLEEPLLNSAHRIRLLNGHYTIIQIQTELSSTPPNFMHDSSCVRPARCEVGWRNLWTVLTGDADGILDQVLPLTAANLLGKLKLAHTVLLTLTRRDIPDQGLLRAIEPNCMQLALKATCEKVKQIETEVADYFVDVA